jgi:hypothetical protein
LKVKLTSVAALQLAASRQIASTQAIALFVTILFIFVGFLRQRGLSPDRALIYHLSNPKKYLGQPGSENTAAAIPEGIPAATETT